MIETTPNITTIRMTVATSVPNLVPTKIHKEVLYTFIPLIVLANAVIIIAYLANHKLRGIQANKYVIAYAAIDLLVGVVFIPCVISQNELITGGMIMYSLLVSLLTLTGSTYDRYVAICKPLRYEGIQTDKIVNRSIWICWILPMIVIALPHSWLREVPRDYLLLEHRIYLGVVVMSMMIILLVLIVAYIKILRIGVHHLHNQLHFRGHYNWSGRIRKEMKFARLFCSLSLTFIVFWFPTGYMSLVDNVFLRNDLMPPEWIRSVNFYWIFMSSLLNPLCYAIFHKSIRATIVALFTLGRSPSSSVHPLGPIRDRGSNDTNNSSISHHVIRVRAIFTFE